MLGRHVSGGSSDDGADGQRVRASGADWEMCTEVLTEAGFQVRPSREGAGREEGRAQDTDIGRKREKGLRGAAARQPEGARGQGQRTFQEGIGGPVSKDKSK